MTNFKLLYGGTDQVLDVGGRVDAVRMLWGSFHDWMGWIGIGQPEFFWYVQLDQELEAVRTGGENSVVPGDKEGNESIEAEICPQRFFLRLLTQDGGPSCLAQKI